MAIKSFAHKGLKKLYFNGDNSGIQQAHTIKVLTILDVLQASHQPRDLRAIFGTNFDHKKGSAKGMYSLKVSGNWRITFELTSDGAVLVDYRDYHGKQLKSKH